jgi:hypothetical protein
MKDAATARCIGDWERDSAQGPAPICNPLQLNLIVDFGFLAVLRKVEFLDVGSETGWEVAEVHG